MLQGMSLVLDRSSSPHLYAGWLPDLQGLTGLTAVCLADNCLSVVPPLAALRELVCLDLSNNGQLQASASWASWVDYASKRISLEDVLLLFAPIWRTFERISSVHADNRSPDHAGIAAAAAARGPARDPRGGQRLLERNQMRLHVAHHVARKVAEAPAPARHRQGLPELTAGQRKWQVYQNRIRFGLDLLRSSWHWFLDQQAAAAVS